VQLALNVADLDVAIDFYSRLFGAQPSKVRLGYANFGLDDPPLKLVLIEDQRSAPGSLNHLGVEVGTSDEVSVTSARLAGAGLTTTEQFATTCCHAVQDKVWVGGPGGEQWEIYTVLADADADAPQPPSACCSRAAGPGR
jgi:catechol 2,3-dioxygenase-like lactoylglutathione lyase family enzyme